MEQDYELLERGEAFVFALPRVAPASERAERAREPDRVRTAEDVQRLYVVQAPEGRRVRRRYFVGRKRLPAPREKHFALIDRTAPSLGAVLEDLGPYAYATRTRGRRFQPCATLVARGHYRLERHEGHVHLGHVLHGHSLKLAHALGVEPVADYIAAVLNPARYGWQYPDALQVRFGERQFEPAAPELLDVEGTEIVLVGVAAGDGCGAPSAEHAPAAVH